MKRDYTLKDLFSERANISFLRASSKKEYSTFLDVRNLEWARGSGLRCTKRRQRLKEIKNMSTGGTTLF